MLSILNVFSSVLLIFIIQYPRVSSLVSSTRDESYLVIDQVCIFAYQLFALTCLGWNMPVQKRSTYLAKSRQFRLRDPASVLHEDLAE